MHWTDPDPVHFEGQGSHGDRVELVGIHRRERSMPWWKGGLWCIG